MKPLLELIDYNKRKTIKNLKQARNDYMAVVYNGLVKRKSTREIHKDIQKITEINMKHGIDTTPIVSYVYKLCDKTKRKIDNLFPVDTVGLLIGEWLFSVFEKKKVFTETNTLTYEYAKKREENDKLNAIKFELDRGRKEEKVFYLASSHKDCAIDHQDYQGKIYVDENWKNIVKDVETLGKIANYVVMNNIKTFQWVIGQPVWLITRPNCRHYFKLLDTEDVLGHTEKQLLKNHKMSHQKGNKITQTLNYKRKEMRKENIINLIRKYEERLEYHEKLYQNNKRIQLIKRAIEKDKLLIKKWKEYLSKFY